MKNYNYIVGLLLLYISVGFAQVSTQYSANNYIRYDKGRLPIVISVPHNGTIMPSHIPDRTCNNAVSISDTYTREVGQLLAASLKKHTGKYPNMIYCDLHRSKLDANRFKSDATCGNAEAGEAWDSFHNFISYAQEYAASVNNGHVFYIDLHCHGHATEWIELGYLLRGSQLDQSDSIINTESVIARSSIQSLVQNNFNKYSHSELVRGRYALGTLLANKGFRSVPSAQDSGPSGRSYFNGGVNTAMHTSYNKDNEVPGLQIEIDFYGTLSTAQRRSDFAEALALSLIEYFKRHMDYDLSDKSSNIDEITSQITIYPNPLSEHDKTISVKGIVGNGYKCKIIDVLGNTRFSGTISDGKLNLENDLPKGSYILSISNPPKNDVFFNVHIMRD